MKEKRALSCFFVRELYPLYSEKGLDDERKTLVEDHLQSCKEYTHYFEKLDQARKKLQELADTHPSQSMIAYLKKEQSLWNDIGEQFGWARWPVTLKWAIELSTVTILLIVVIHFVPWVKVVKLARQMRPRPPVVVATKETPPPVEPNPTAPLEKEVPQEVAEKPSEPQPEPENEEQNPIEEKEEAQPETAGVVSEADQSKETGFVWRGTLKVDELNDDMANKVTKIISDLGGTKAGQVELGWHRGTQRYYHFILPEENYEKMLSMLNTEGLIQLTKERHPRTIRTGHMRIIMTVEENQE